ncbi:NfeD family protein [Alteromonas gilva]|uniref:NfeD family protein n=1 Tax=Alteromonas gilva TaxID=2987522 RepID=A0ABT5KZM7_9ALTE|nr:NfeD family protein [Alteromonas gilva]MDC8829644.1 NfeD family protein [Alteromonas gilva]
MEWINDNITTALVVTGLLLLIIEVAVLGFATFVLFFVGIAALVTALVFYLNLLEPTYLNAFYSCALFTALAALVLYKPLKTMQQQVEKKSVAGDFTGLRFRLAESVGPAAPGKYKHSGITWNVLSNQRIEAGAEVEVVNAEVGTFHVEPVSVS